MKSVLHLFFSDLTLETRLFKESYYLNNRDYASSHALGFVKGEQPLKEINKYKLHIYRILLPVERYRETILYKNRIFRFLLKLFSFFMFSIWALSFSKKIDVNYVSIHNCALLPIGVLIKKTLKIKLIYQPHELESKKVGINRLTSFLYYLIERAFISQANSVITVCEPITDWYKNKYHITNIFTVRNVPDKEQLNKNRTRSFYDIFDIPQSELIFIYQGLISDTRGASFLIDTFNHLQKQLVLMGRSDIEINGTRYVHHYPPVEKNQIISQTSMASVGVHINNERSLSYQYSLPNKFFEYMHSGIPIIVSSNMTYLSNIVIQNNLGWVVEDNFEELLTNLSARDLLDKRQSILNYAKGCVFEKDAAAYELVYE